MIEFAVIFSPGADLDVDMGQVMEVPAAPSYDGEYEVVPKVYTEQTLPTSGKLLGRDVLVHKIPQFEVSNGSGGKTLIIGEE
jgi:hypothetical protein|nr:MAG TPA_asm: hypothetical protein [Caudoviricetes sp.]